MSIKSVISDNLISGQSMSESFVSAPLLLVRAPGFNVQLVFTGSPVGTFSLQASADLTFEIPQIVNWDIISGSAQEITEAGSHSWRVNDRYKWVRVVYVRTSGTGSCNGTIFAIEER